MTNPGRKTARTHLRPIVGLVVVTALAAGLFALSRRPEPEKSGANVDRALARTMSFEITTTAVGELEARNQIELRSRLDTRAAIVDLVPEGKRVTAGEMLVKLNGDDIQTQIDEERLKVNDASNDATAAENAYSIQESQNASDLRKAQLDVDLARLALQQWLEGDVKIMRLSLELNLDRATRERTRLVAKFEQADNLFKQDFLSKDERDQDEVAMIKSEADFKTAILEQDAYEKYQYQTEEKEKNSAVAEAEAELERVKLSNTILLGSKDADRKIKADQFRLRQARLAKLQASFEACMITAPTDGLVVYASSVERGRNMFGGNNEGPMAIGREVSPNQLLIILPDTSEMVASVRVHESLTARMRPGMAATIKVDAAGGGTFPGHVESIGVLAESNNWRDPNLREYTVKIALEQSSEVAALKPSMRAEAQIVLGGVQDALSVPVQAVFSDGPVRYVLVAEGGAVVRRPVQVGRRSDLYAQIISGLEGGQTVLIRDPAAGEVTAVAWNPDDLRSAGYELDDQGKVKSPGGMEGRPSGAPGRDGPPLGRGQAPAEPGAADGGGKDSTDSEGRPSAERRRGAKPQSEGTAPSSSGQGKK